MPEQWIVIIAATVVVFGYVVRMGSYHIDRDSILIGVTHYAGFASSVWVGFQAWSSQPTPMHGLLLISAVAWLVFDHLRLPEAKPSTWTQADR